MTIIQKMFLMNYVALICSTGNKVYNVYDVKIPRPVSRSKLRKVMSDKTMNQLIFLNPVS
jgi:hypothetical protein